MRTYFEFDKVRQGLLDVTGRLFGLRYEPVADAVVWHEDVTAYDVFSSGTPTTDGESLGRIYLDLHPREGKYKHAAQFTIANGVAGRQLPEGALVCNFSNGLMEHDHVVTLFHEFGHLVHHVLGGHVGWTRFAGVATEWDFVEAPSQMLEEWAWDADVLQTFATNAAGEPIPADLVERMRAADDFGKGLQARQQMFYAAMSYWFHTERPADLTAQAGRAPGALLAVPLHRRHPLLRQLRPPGRLLVGVLHLHVVAGDREGPVLRLRPRRPVRRHRRAAIATRSSPRAAPRTPPTSSPTSSAAPTPSTRTPPGWRGSPPIAGAVSPAHRGICRLSCGCNRCTSASSRADRGIRLASADLST